MYIHIWQTVTQRYVVFSKVILKSKIWDKSVEDNQYALDTNRTICDTYTDEIAGDANKII